MQNYVQSWNFKMSNPRSRRIFPGVAFQLFVIILLMFLAFQSLSPGSNISSDAQGKKNGVAGGERSNGLSRNNAEDWVFSGNRKNELRDTDNRIVSESIFVRDNATLIIDNSTLNLAQESDFQFTVIVSGYGTLILNQSSITSNRIFHIFLQDHGRIELLNNSEFKNSWTTINSSECSLVIDGSTLDVGNTTIPLVKNLFLRNIRNQRSLEGLEIDVCGERVLVEKSILSALQLNATGRLDIRDSIILNGPAEASIIGCVEENIIVDNSSMDHVVVKDYRMFVVKNSNVLHMVISHTPSVEDVLEISNSNIQDLIVDFPTNLHISGGTIFPSRVEYTAALCSARNFVADQGVVFQHPLNFSSDSNVFLENVSAPSIVVAEQANVKLHNWPSPMQIKEDENSLSYFFIPGVEVLDSGIVHLFRTLSITVLDSDGNPLEGVETSILRDITNLTLYRATTGKDGRADFMVYSNYITGERVEFEGYYRYVAELSDMAGSSNPITNEGSAAVFGPLDIEVVMDTQFLVSEEETDSWVGRLILGIFTTLLLGGLLVILLTKRNKNRF